MPADTGDMLAVLAATAALAFTSGSGELYVGDHFVAGDDSVAYQALELTPGGASVLAIESGEATRLVLMAVGGGEPKPVPGTTDADSGSISPDGKTVVFTTLEGVYTVPVAGGTPKELVTTPDGATDSLAEFSPEGRTIAFARDSVDDDGNESVTLEIVSASGGKPVSRSDGLLGSLPQGGRISFSPDGRLIAYAGDADNPGIFVEGASTGEPRQLTSDLDSWPVFSEDGQTISFARDATSEHADDNSDDPVELLDEDTYELWNVPAAGGTEAFVHEGDYETLAVEQAAAQPSHVSEPVVVTVTRRGHRYTVRWTGTAAAWKVTLAIGTKSVGAAFKGSVHSATFTLHASGKPVARVTAR
jgi:dipeptidyl aminopeptidase/acylaminoacyl peptidase